MQKKVIYYSIELQLMQNKAFEGRANACLIFVNSHKGGNPGKMRQLGKEAIQDWASQESDQYQKMFKNRFVWRINIINKLWWQHLRSMANILLKPRWSTFNCSQS
jgi:hypothetical protein